MEMFCETRWAPIAVHCQKRQCVLRLLLEADGIEHELFISERQNGTARELLERNSLTSITERPNCLYVPSLFLL